MELSSVHIGVILFGLIFVMFFSVLLGMRSAAREDKLFRIVRRTRRATGQINTARLHETNEFRQVTWHPGKVKVASPTITPRSMTVFALGQSNAANTGGEKYVRADDRVTNFWAGQFYLATDPILGASGTSGSVWPNLAEKLITLGIADQVVIVSAAIGGTSIAEWRTGGRLYAMLEARLIEAAAQMVVTDFFWHQGEADNPLVNPSGLAQYDDGLREVVQLTKLYFPKSNFFVAIATIALDSPASPELRAAQERATLIDGVYRGPCTDDIGLDDRYDGVHFSGRGIDKHSDGWVTAIQAQRNMQ